MRAVEFCPDLRGADTDVVAKGPGRGRMGSQKLVLTLWFADEPHRTSHTDISSSHNSATQIEKQTHSHARQLHVLHLTARNTFFPKHGSGAATVLNCRDSAEFKFSLVAELLRNRLETSSSVARMKEQESVIQWLE